MLKAFAVRSLLPEMLIGRTVYDGDSEDVLVEGGTVLDKETIKGAPASYDAATLSTEEVELRRVLHATIKKVTEDVRDRFMFNTAISSIMELVNALYAF